MKHCEILLYVTVISAEFNELQQALYIEYIV